MHQFSAYDAPRLFGFQWKLNSKILLARDFITLEDLLSRRINTFLTIGKPNKLRFALSRVPFVCSHLRRIASCAKPCIVFCFLKWLANAICTTARFHKTIEECPFCGTFCGDHIEHLSLCQWGFEVSNRFWGTGLTYSRYTILTLHEAAGPMDDGCIDRLVMHLFLVLKAYYCCKHGSRPVYTVYHGLAVTIAGQDIFARRTFSSSSLRQGQRSSEGVG